MYTQLLMLKKGVTKLVREEWVKQFIRARSQLSFALKIIKKCFKLANVFQLAQMYAFAPDPGKNIPSLIL